MLITQCPTQRLLSIFMKEVDYNVNFCFLIEHQRRYQFAGVDEILQQENDDKNLDKNPVLRICKLLMIMT